MQLYAPIRSVHEESCQERVSGAHNRPAVRARLRFSSLAETRPKIEHDDEIFCPPGCAENTTNRMRHWFTKYFGQSASTPHHHMWRFLSPLWKTSQRLSHTQLEMHTRPSPGLSRCARNRHNTRQTCCNTVLRCMVRRFMPNNPRKKNVPQKKKKI